MDKVYDWSEPIVTAASRMLQNLLEHPPQFAGAVVVDEGLDLSLGSPRYPACSGSSTGSG